MKTEELNSTVLNVLDQATDIKNKLYNIVWQGQEGQLARGEQHFDDLPKAQRVALTGLLNNAINLVQSLAMYDSWFINTK